ncbi:GspH/FimT family pseudopilin [Aquitalea sp. ASV15]|uniref:GspH/FimT family pseudopilin n=1 Tax=Aquitalea sp. ASV15 TaxID=2795104 RepID=UPI0018EB1F80|nr:GspH/FimT family pseudopilin [Aquitalea sp. ASV15]
MSCPDAGRRGGGFTLYELLIVLAVSAILLAQTLPAMQDMLERQRLLARGQLLQSGLQLAGSEAIRGNRTVWVCALNSKVNLEIQGCQSGNGAGNWSEGLLVFADAPSRPDGRYDSGERLHHLLFSSTSVQLSANRQDFAFTPHGRLHSGTVPRFQLRTPGGQCHSLLLQPSGKAQWCSQDNCCD